VVYTPISTTAPEKADTRRKERETPRQKMSLYCLHEETSPDPYTPLNIKRKL
jgi:hypothetical protein